MKNFILKALTLSLCILSFSCYYDETVEEVIPDIPDDQPVSFSIDIQPIFIQEDKDCTACHNGTVANPDLREGNAYDAIVPEYVVAGDAEASELFQKLPGNDHPVEAGFLVSTDEMSLIKTWIDRGAENN